MTTFIYGVIEEYGPYYSGSNETYVHNAHIISMLPAADPWPPLSREMFAITQNSDVKSPDLEYLGRIIHFGACLKSVELEWLEWKAKFEELLQKLYWSKAYVHFKTEYTGLISFEWKADLDKDNIAPVQRERWKFEDVNGWEKQYSRA